MKPDTSPLATSSPLVHGFGGAPVAGAATSPVGSSSASNRRRAGVLAHVSSLAGPDGIGDIGPTSRDFVTWLASADQRLWSFLPLHPPANDSMSPYDSASAFAGNPLLISLDDLVDLGLLPDSLDSIRRSVGVSAPPALTAVLPDRRAPDDSIERAARWKLPLLRQAARQLLTLPQTHELAHDFLGFCAREAWWLSDHVAFTAMRERHPGVGRSEWPKSDRVRRLGAERASTLAIGATHRHHEAAIQYFFDLQMQQLHSWARQHGVWLMGDVPIYVGDDSADVWAHPTLFQLDSEQRPAWTTGAPPDEFDARGQIWGTPAYDWKANSESGYEWWLRRLSNAFRHCDVLRIDHFRGFADWWRVPIGAAYGEQGSWQEGPGRPFFDAVRRELGECELIVEDLGPTTEALDRLRIETGLPRMRVLVQGFEEGGGSVHLPPAWTGTEAAYTATHDYSTVREWADAAQRSDHSEQLAFALRFTGAGSVEELAAASIDTVLASTARFAIAGLPDWLGLGAEGRLNVPGTAHGNWRWRVPDGALDEQLAERMSHATAGTDRT